MLTHVMGQLKLLLVLFAQTTHDLIGGVPVLFQYPSLSLEIFAVASGFNIGLKNKIE